MPTLSSIKIHEVLRRKLVKPDDGTDDSSATTQETNSVVRAPQQTASNEKKMPIRANIYSPQALLSRDPNQVCEDIIGCNNNRNSIPLQAVLDLRYSVADALIHSSDCGHGKESKRVKQSVNSRIRSCDGCSVESSILSHLRKRPPLIAGSFSALDYCIHHAGSTQHLSDSNATPLAIQTGSDRLDHLLSPPTELMKAFTSNFSHLMPPESNVSLNRSGGGIPFGFITEITGPPASGKTQLALSVVSAAALQSVSVHYLASGGGNSTIVPLARRLLTIMRSSHPEFKLRSNQQILTSILERVKFHSVKDGYHALAILNEIEQNFENSHYPQKDRDSSNKPNGYVTNDFEFRNPQILIILDSVSGCFSPNNNFTSSMDGGLGRAVVHEVGMMFKKLTRIQNHAILVTNGTVGSLVLEGDTTIIDNLGRNDVNSNDNYLRRYQQPAMKNMWKVADIRLYFEIVEDIFDPNENEGHQITVTRKIRAVLDKHYAKKCDPMRREFSKDYIHCAISSAGIVDF